MYRKLTTFVAALALILAACGTYQDLDIVVDKDTGKTVLVDCDKETVSRAVSTDGCKIYDIVEYTNNVLP